MPGPAATVGSMHVCPMVTGYIPHIGGPVSGPGAPNVLINGKPAALMGDMCVCVGPPDTVAQGEPTVLINGTPVATMGSMTAHGGSITVGEPTVMVGSATPGAKATMPLNKIPFPEIRIIDRVGAMMRGRSSDLRQAEANQNQIREEAEVEVEPKIYNLRWMKEQKIVRESKVIKKVMLRASVLGAKDGQSVSIKVKKKVKNEDGSEEIEDLVTLSGEVQDNCVEVEWEVEDEQTVNEE